MAKDFKNPIDQLKVGDPLKDEEVDFSFFPSELDTLKFSLTAPHLARNSFESLNHTHDISSAAESRENDRKMAIQAEKAIKAWEHEESQLKIHVSRRPSPWSSSSMITEFSLHKSIGLEKSL